jgi:hypothetical protein
MVKIKLIGILLLLLNFSCKTGKQDQTATFEMDAGCIQIVLFHMAWRCESCVAVELETKSILEQEYGEALKSGKVRFLSFDFQSENGRNAARQLKASGQTLFIVKGDSISNLTGPAFLFAHTHPERYRDALIRELDKYLE